MDASGEVIHHELVNAPVEDAMVRLLSISGAPDWMIEDILLRMSTLDDTAKARLRTELPKLIRKYLYAQDSDSRSPEALYDRRNPSRGGRRSSDLLEAGKGSSDGDVDTYLLDATLRETPGLMSGDTVCAQDECTAACGFIHLVDDEDLEIRSLREAVTDGMISRNERILAQGGTPVWL